jgi:hypothetical protein
MTTARGDISLLEVVALREDGSRWCVPVRTMRQAFKAARRLRWRKRWPTWICRHDMPADQRTIKHWRQWRAWTEQPPVGGLH